MDVVWTYQKLLDGVYAVFFQQKRCGVVFRYGSGWCFSPNGTSQIFISRSRDGAVSPHFSYAAYKSYVPEEV